MTSEDEVQEPPEYLTRDTVALWTPIANADALAAVCALNGFRCDVLAFRHGTLAVVVDTSEGSVDRVARGVSTIVKDATIHAMERRDGHLTVVAWTGGVRGDEIPPGLALDRAPEAVIALMSGAMTIETILEHSPEVVHSGHLSRWRAFWQLRRLNRADRSRDTDQPSQTPQ